MFVPLAHTEQNTGSYTTATTNGAETVMSNKAEDRPAGCFNREMVSGPFNEISATGVAWGRSSRDHRGVSMIRWIAKGPEWDKRDGV